MHLGCYVGKSDGIVIDVVCEVRDVNTLRGAANRRLIVEAPEMRALLEEIRAYCTVERMHIYGEKIRILLARIDGEQP
jgi:hypothetical protein